ncbi:MAG TPA: hypothetical protein VGH71_08200 [Gammaproteobacteria bacterium]|jgi:hypothetical protein
MKYLLAVLLTALSPALWAEPVAQLGPELREVSAFRLDMKFIKALSGATEEVKGYEQDHPEDAPKIEGDPEDDTDTLDRRILRIRKLPAVMALLKKHGLSAQTYVVGGMALLQASGGAMMVNMRSNDPDVWKSLQARGINTDNVHFYLAHQDEIEKLADYEEPARGTAPLAPATAAAPPAATQ